jgi:hypothetical protein
MGEDRLKITFDTKGKLLKNKEENRILRKLMSNK